MKPQVWDTIQEFEGEGRNEKLENLVYFALFERNEIQQEIDLLEKSRDTLQQEIEQYRKIIGKLKRVEWGVNDLLMIADGIEKGESD